MDELIPGVSVTNLEGVPEGVKLEQEMLRQEILREKANRDAQIENRCIGILTEIGIRLSKGYPVELTQEMEDLGLKLRILEMIQKAEYAYQLNRFLQDEDDFDDDAFYYL